MKIVVADRKGVLTFAAEDADKDILILGDSALVIGEADSLKPILCWKCRKPSGAYGKPKPNTIYKCLDCGFD